MIANQNGYCVMQMKEVTIHSPSGAKTVLFKPMFRASGEQFLSQGMPVWEHKSKEGGALYAVQDSSADDDAGLRVVGGLTPPRADGSQGLFAGQWPNEEEGDPFPEGFDPPQWDVDRYEHRDIYITHS